MSNSHDEFNILTDLSMGNVMKKNILIVDNGREIEELLRGPFLQKLQQSQIIPSIIRAKDGADAALKSENQKFDMVIIDMDVPRLMDGGFIHGLQSYRNTQKADIVVLSRDSKESLPPTLSACKFFQKPVSTEHLIITLVSLVNGEAAHKNPSHSKYSVDVRVINAVISAVTSVLNKFGVEDITMEKSRSVPAQDPLLGEVSSVMDIKSASFQGFLAISFDKNSYLEVVSKMLMEEQTEITEDNQDAVGEINNVILGNAKSEISQLGVEMTLPQIHVGKNVLLKCPLGSAAMLIPFKTRKGSFYINIIALPL